MKLKFLVLTLVCFLLAVASSQAGGRCGRGGWGGGGFYGPGFGWGGSPFWGPSFGVSVIAPAPVYRTVYVSQPVRVNRSLPRSLVAQTQVQLARRGYYNGSIDGAFGPQTNRALGRYQIDAGLPVSGRIDRRTLASLGIRA